ncbi:aminodeoxychorismate lyase [Thiofilum flexile]|uniref:aminodeoxychorismate lyase n=1 Tax=Thiofilum flexile TaxID=125627 RepID=UPI00036B1FC1|nr:aminodeoxychorismate lyase [Thiofilum flexile]
MLSIPVDDRGLAYGDGLWETIAVKDGILLLLDEHLARLELGSQILRIRGLDLMALKQELEEYCKDTERGVLKLIVTRGSSQRGYNPAGLTTPRIIIQLHPAPDYPRSYYEQGITLGLVAGIRLAYQPYLTGLKHLNRLEQVLGRAECEAHWQEGLMMDHQHYVIEGTMSNVFIYTQEQVLITPYLSGSGIEGIMRGQVLKLAQQLGIECRTDLLRVQDILSARSVFVTNSVIGLWPVREFKQQSYVIADTIHTLQQQLKPYCL